jgi:hypothetical protein
MRRLRAEYGDIYNDYATTSVGVMLVDLMAYAADQLSWYLDRSMTDVYLDTARTRSAIAKLTRQIGYKMRPAAAATVDLTVSFTPAIPSPGQLQAGFRMQGPNGLVYEVIADTFLATGITSIVVPCREGETRLISYTGSGELNQRFRMQGASEKDGTWVADQSVRMWVDGSEWDEKPFLDFEKTNHFQANYLDDPPLVLCGDGVAGNVPENGSDVKIQYVVIHGQSGMVKSGAITAAIDRLVIAGTAITLACAHALGSSGGADPETADMARTLAPFSFAARGATITSTDYQALVNGFSDSLYGRVSKGYAVNVRSSAEDGVLINYFEQIEAFLTLYYETVRDVEAAIATDASDALATGALLTAEVAKVTAIRTGALEPNVAALRTHAQVIRTEMDKGIAAHVSLNESLNDALELVTDPAVKALINQAISAGSTMRTSIETGKAVAGAIDGVAVVMSDAISLTGNGVQSIAQSESVLTSLQVTENALLSSIAVTFAPIPGLALQLKNDVNGVVEDIQTYTSELFDADCKVNYVQVPIVSVNGDGDYVSPASGLIQGLQAYLETTKEVTQLVKVVDGGDMLVPVDITVELSLSKGVVGADKVSAVEAALIALLRGRDFNQPLYMQTVRDKVSASADGIVYANVHVSAPGHAEYVDGDGNVVTPASFIITRGTVSVVEVRS